MFRLRAGAATHVGAVRMVNEDCVVLEPVTRVWAVADGMGGHQRGDWASANVSQALTGLALPEDLDADCNRIADALAEANATIFQAAENAKTTIGSTVVVLHVVSGRYAGVWAGDSRLYLHRRGALSQLSRDHSQVEELIAGGLIQRADAKGHPLGNIITRAIGVAADLALDVVTGDLEDNDRFVLCSDGLTGCMSDAEIAAGIDGRAPQDACDLLIQECLARGATDNVSVVVVVCEMMTLTTLGGSAPAQSVGS